MTTWKHWLLAAYYYGTRPYRLAANALAARRGQAPVIVVFYHRVADHSLNPWTMTNDQFTAQIEWMEHRFDMVSLAEAQRRIRSRSNHRPAVAITFDDGYADNCERALPLLIAKRIPCTYFVATQFVLENKPFPHDVHAGRPLRPNTLDQLRSLARAGVEIGGHTGTHADLGPISDFDQLYDEVVVASRDLAAAIDRPVRYFAFPFGMYANLNTTAIRLLRQHGCEGFCSAYGGYNMPGDDPFHLQRIHGDPHWLRMKNWLTVDPRQRRVSRFNYGSPHDADHPTASAGARVLEAQGHA